MKIIYRGEGLRNYVSDASTPEYLNYDGRINIELRGSSSQEMPKKQYGLSTKKADGITKNNVSILGMPADNDWILHSNVFDPSMIRNWLSFNLVTSDWTVCKQNHLLRGDDKRTVYGPLSFA